jgi:hypothetical protein
MMVSAGWFQDGLMLNAFRIFGILAALLGSGSSVLAQETKPVPRSAEIARPTEQVFRALKNYFADSGTHRFELVSADQATGKIVARRHGIDDNTWRELAYCEVPAINILDTLQDGTVTVHVRLKPDRPNRTYVTVTADFKGYYALGNAQHTVNCQSKGVLEKDILASAGPSQPESTD